jgi:hypothetical protein
MSDKNGYICNPAYHGVKPIGDFEYCFYEELEDDNRKYFHDIFHKGQLVGSPRWFHQISPYQFPTQEEFAKAVDELKLIMFAKGDL